MIYIFGDSFSADNKGWPSIINSATTGYRGSSEYRIYKNYLEYKDLITDNDIVIFCHTHKDRVYLKDENQTLLSRLVDTHPFCDILFSDVVAKQEQDFVHLLKEIWDDKFFDYIYDKILKDCKDVPNSIHITFFKEMATTYNLIDYSEYYKNYKGKINHLTELGNHLVAEKIQDVLQEFK